jgi:hypothetical protein
MALLRTLATGCSPSDHDTASSLLHTVGSMYVIGPRPRHMLQSVVTIPGSVTGGVVECMVCFCVLPRSSATLRQLSSKQQQQGRRLTSHLSLRVGHAWDMEGTQTPAVDQPSHHPGARGLATAEVGAG